VFGPKLGRARAVGGEPVLCLERFPLRGEAPKKGIEKSHFVLMGGSGHGRGSRGDGEQSDASLVEGGNKAVCDRRGNVCIL